MSRKKKGELSCNQDRAENYHLTGLEWRRCHGRKSAPMKLRQPSRRRQIGPRQRRPRRAGSSLADGVICRYAYAACFTSGCRIMLMSPQLLCTPPPSAGDLADAAYSGEDRMSRRLVYPCRPPPLPLSSSLPAPSGISITGGGAHRGTCFLGLRQCRSSKSPAAEPMPSDERGRTPPCSDRDSGMTDGTDGMAGAIGIRRPRARGQRRRLGSVRRERAQEDEGSLLVSFCTAVIYRGGALKKTVYWQVGPTCHGLVSCCLENQ
jgi:hypothetical protein